MNQVSHLNVCLAAVFVFSLTMPALSAKCPGWCNNKVNKKKGWKDTIVGQTTPKCQWNKCQECPQWKDCCASSPSSKCNVPPKCPGWCNNKNNIPKGWLDTIDGQTTPKCYWKKCFQCPEWKDNCETSTSCGSLHVANSDQEGTLVGSTGDGVQVNCADGFTGGSAQVTCKALGEGTSAHSAWTGAPTCVAASCGALVVNNSNQLGTTSGATGDTTLVICKEGGYATAECEGTGMGVSAWNNAPTCEGCTKLDCFRETRMKGYWDCHAVREQVSKEDCATLCLQTEGGCGGFSMSDGTCRVMSKRQEQLVTDCKWKKGSSYYYKSKAQGPVGDETKFYSKEDFLAGYPQAFGVGFYCDTYGNILGNDDIPGSAEAQNLDVCHTRCQNVGCKYFSFAEGSKNWCMLHKNCDFATYGGYENGNPYKVYQPTQEEDGDGDYDGQGSDVSRPRLLQDSKETPSGMFNENRLVNAVVI